MIYWRGGLNREGFSVHKNMLKLLNDSILQHAYQQQISKKAMYKFCHHWFPNYTPRLLIFGPIKDFLDVAKS